MEENPSGVQKADIVVAIPTFNEVTTIANVTSKVDEGLRLHYPSLKSVIVNCDNCSTDGTKEAFLATETHSEKVYLSTPPGVRGKGNNLRNFFSWVRDLQPEVVVIIEADIRNIKPLWIYCLVEPILKGAGFVVPLYVSHKYESTIESLVLYPLLRCLYGRRLRRPAVGECAFGQQLVDAYSKAEVWSQGVGEDGIDIWMVTEAIKARVPLCQSFLGAPKVHRLKEPFSQINRAFSNMVGVFFDLMGPFQDLWLKVKWSRPTILFNADTLDVEAIAPMEVNIYRLYDLYARGFDRYKFRLESILHLPEMRKLEEVRNLGFGNFAFPDHTWAIVLFDFALAYRDASPEDREEILDALLPLYYGKVVSFVKKTERMSTQQAEEVIEKECMVFEENKRYLVNNWIKT
ncbi:MAG TPA: glycosyltransferase [Thermodesulforhabdus norvegica]|uniref:Glycosyltransferase n=1 Tax=Thermodesulforhabdus norvegica TaxID=39841 RepID=A0A7C0WRC2_9BACT|nr:glycosyltransferase [Thermodesulforhabdus norvegica]